MITNFHAAVVEGLEPTVKRRKPDGSRIDMPCPPCLLDYRAYMMWIEQIKGWDTIIWVKVLEIMENPYN